MRVIDRVGYLASRRQENHRGDVRPVVEQIINQVITNGDRALYELTAKYDVSIDDMPLRLTLDELKRIAYSDSDITPLLREAGKNIKTYHQCQIETSQTVYKADGSVLGLWVRPLKRVGLYVPGGRAAYPSSVLMNAIPAQVAGVEEIAIVTPPTANGSIHPAVAQAALSLGITEVYRVGGAQSIAALAYGTEQIPRVDKIVGPGNAFVAEAKRQVYGVVDIDMVAGPSEILVVVEPGMPPKLAAADLLAQAEHDPDSIAVAVTWCKDYAQAISRAVEEMVQSADRKEIIETSLARNGAIVLVDSLDEALLVANEIAPEHLELMVNDPWSYVGRIENAGAIFLGPNTPESLGDYWAGPNHVLPTGGTARFSSPLGVYDFYKRSSVLFYSEAAARAAADSVLRLAQAEGLAAHGEAMRLRG